MTPEHRSHCAELFMKGEENKAEKKSPALMYQSLKDRAVGDEVYRLPMISEIAPLTSQFTAQRKKGAPLTDGSAPRGSKQTEVSSDHAALLKNGFDAYHSAPQDRPWSVDAAMKYLKGALGPASVPGEFPTQAALKRFLGNLVRVGGVAPTPAFAAAAPVAAQAAPAAAAAAAAVQLATAAPPPPPQGPRGREPASLALVPPPAAQEESETRHSSRGRLIKESRRRAGGL